MTTLERPDSLADRINGCDHRLHRIATYLELDVEDFVTEVMARDEIRRAIQQIDDASESLRLALQLIPESKR